MKDEKTLDFICDVPNVWYSTNGKTKKKPCGIVYETDLLSCAHEYVKDCKYYKAIHVGGG